MVVQGKRIHRALNITHAVIPLNPQNHGTLSHALQVVSPLDPPAAAFYAAENQGLGHDATAEVWRQSLQGLCFLLFQEGEKWIELVTKKR